MAVVEVTLVGASVVTERWELATNATRTMASI